MASFDWPPAAGGGSGDVTGPGSSTDNAVTRFDGTGGKTLQDSGVIIDDSNNMSGVGTLTTTGDVNGASPTEMGHLSGATSNIQTQINNITSTVNNFEWYNSALDYITDNTAAPPTEVSGDRYVLSHDGGAPHANWDGASAGDIVEFSGSTWDATTPATGGFIAVDDDASGLYNWGGASWDFKNFEATTASTGLTKSGFDIQLDSSAAGDGLGFAAGVLSTNVDDSTIETSADSLQLKDNGITDAKVNSSAAIAQSKLALDITNSEINASAAIAHSKMAALTASRATETNGSGEVVASSVTSTELGHVSGVTSGIQSQINGKQDDVVTTQGDIIRGDGSGDAERLALGADNKILRSDGSDAVWGELDTAGSSAPGTNQTVAATDDTTIVYTPTADIDVTLNTTFDEGRTVTIVNAATGFDITVKSNNGDTLETVYRETRNQFRCTDSTASTSAHWEVLQPQTVVLYEVKTLSSDVTSNTDPISDLTFTVESGKTYRVSGNYFGANSSSDSQFEVTIDENSNVIDVQIMGDKRDTGSGQISRAFSCIFEATGTSVTFATTGMGTGTELRGNSTRAETYAVIEELPTHQVSTKF